MRERERCARGASASWKSAARRLSTAGASDVGVISEAWLVGFSRIRTRNPAKVDRCIPKNVEVEKFMPDPRKKSTDSYQKPGMSTCARAEETQTERKTERERERDSERCARGASFVEECCKEALDRRCVQRFLAGLLSS